MFFNKSAPTFLLIALLTISHALCKPGILTNQEPDDLQSLRKSVFNLLKNPDIGEELNEKVRISFFVTADYEVVVLKTDARTVKLDKFIKKRLNYSKIKANHSETNRVYHMMVYFRLHEILQAPG